MTDVDLMRRAWRARWAILRAGQHTLKYFGTKVAIEQKSDLTPVTIADREAEEMLRGELGREFPGDGFLGEEFGRSESKTGYTWVIDPIDATKNFIRGIPLYATLVGLMKGETVVAGFAYVPPTGELYHAVKGEGAFRNDTPIRVSDVARWEDAYFCYSSLEAFDAASTTPAFIDLIRSTGRNRGFGDYYGYLLVAGGNVDAMLEPDINPWDIAALKPIIEEAGGVMTDIAGKDTIFGKGAVAANPALHRIMMAKLNRA